MKTQLSRNSFDAKKRYSGIYQQMGRMLTDADWNELTDLSKSRLADALTDIIGSGTPRDRGLVRIAENPDGSKSYTLQWGYCYVDGIIAQVRPDPAATLTDPTGVAFEYEHQADFPGAPALPAGDYQLYVDVWERTVIALEDQQLLDPGLHGADTCTRTQTMAQVKWCETEVTPENAAHNPPVGEAKLTLELRQGSTEPDPCDPCAEEIALQDKLGNYLFRVEVHDVQYNASGQPERVILKWSSENGAEQYAIGVEPTGFGSDNWVYEFFDGFLDPDAITPETYDSEKHLGKHLATGFTPVRGELTKGYPDSVPSDYTAVRRWDGYCALEKIAGNWTLVAGADRGVDLSTGSSSDAHGHVTEGSTVIINHDVMTLTVEIADLPVLAGDFWYAVVRQAVNVAGDVLLIDEEPRGIVHHYMTLGSVIGGEFVAYDSDQCKRFEFPPLTDILATDVCYDGSQCDSLSTAKTVQDAIDQLCHSRDLRWHNKHLHGWGIVCGLIARCGPDTHIDPDDEDGVAERREVKITSGYAITCEGDDIVLESERIIDLIQRIEALEEQGTQVLKEGNGTVCLRLERDANGQPQVVVEPYDSEKHADKSILDGTLLMDFYQKCIVDLVEAIVSEFKFLNTDELNEVEGGTNGPVSIERRKLTSFINLIVQLFNQENGSYVFLSRKEHLILRDIYLNLRSLLQSKTFCAMFQGQDFPDYPFEKTGMTTYFGKNLHTRIQLHPSGDRVYSYGGTDNTINVYSVEKQELIQVLEMPSAEGAEVSAITFSQDGALLYAAASVRGIDSVFGIARVNDNHAWEEMTILCDIEITGMQMSQKDSGLIYAVGYGKGLFYLRPEVLMDQEKPRPEPVYAFNAVGHLAIDSQAALAYCTGVSKDIDPDRYDRVFICNLNIDGQQTQNPQELPLTDESGQTLSGTDGLTVSQKSGRGSGRLYVVVDGPNGADNKRLLTYNLPVGDNNQPVSTLDIENTTVSLAYHQESKQVLLAMEDGYRIQTVDENGKKSNVFRVPVQIQPTDVRVDSGSGQIYALNYISNTVSVIPANELDVTDAFLQQLAQYRQEVLRVFYALFGGLLQYLKDCFCDHLLVKCPTCDDEDVIYLATVEVRDNKVYNICNFDKRKYVKSFPTMEYWFSIVPVWPLLKTTVGRLCCSILPDFFAKQQDNVIKPIPAIGSAQTVTNRVSANTARKSVQTYQRTDIRAGLRNQVKTTQFIGQLATDRAVALADTGRRKNIGVRKQALLQSDVNDAIKELNNNQVEVAAIKKYDANNAGVYLTEFNQTPQRIDPGSKVTLYQKDGKVAFYAIEKQPATVTATLPDNVKAELQDFENRKQALANFDALNAELAKVETRRADLGELSAVRTEIDTLKSEKLAVQEELAALKVQVESIQSVRNTLSAELVELNKNILEAGKQQQDLRFAVNKTKPVMTLPLVTAEIDTDLRSLGISTVEDLAGADATRLTTVRSISSATAKRLIVSAQDLITKG
ncbi:MAG: DUF6519 domain-containing protein [Nitrosomonas sp.]|nr:DUF6519 domain-containing protein [Nitrosomonas sp.]